MGCGCGGKKGTMPNRNVVRNTSIQQNIVRSIGTGVTEALNQQITTPVGMDKNRLEIERKRREAIKKSLGKMI